MAPTERTLPNLPRRKARAALVLAGLAIGVADKGGRLPGEVSGGEAERAAVARRSSTGKKRLVIAVAVVLVGAAGWAGASPRPKGSGSPR